MGLWTICKSCFLFDGSIFYLLYAIIVLAVSFVKLRGTLAHKSALEGSLPPLPGEIGKMLSITRLPIVPQIMALIVGIADFDVFRRIVAAVVKFIRIVFLMNDNPTVLRSLRRYLNLYLLIIPLPAAFLAPVLHQQRQPDLELLVAGLLTIVVNAIGDLVSVRLVLWNFETLQYKPSAGHETDTQDFWRNVRNEAMYYLTVLAGVGCSLGVLIVVLALCSVFFGVQIGELEFSFSWKFVVGAWHRILDFPSLAFEPYWFRGQPGPFGSKGVPGMFLFGIITFIPMILLGALTAIWLVLLPFRIAVTLPTGVLPRIAASEVAVITLCVVVSYFEKIDVLSLYGFLFRHI